MLCLRSRVINSRLFLVLSSLLFINGCIAKENDSLASSNTLGDNLNNKELEKHNAYYKLIRTKRESLQRPTLVSPSLSRLSEYDILSRRKRGEQPIKSVGSVSSDLLSPFEFDKLTRRKRQGSRSSKNPPVRPSSSQNQEIAPECQNNAAWVPPGLKKKGGMPPGQQKKMNGPCGSRIPPGQRKKQWPPPIDETNKDFKYPVEEFPVISQSDKNYDVAYIENNRRVILLRPEDIRK